MRRRVRGLLMPNDLTVRAGWRGDRSRRGHAQQTERQGGNANKPSAAHRLPPALRVTGTSSPPWSLSAPTLWRRHAAVKAGSGAAGPGSGSVGPVEDAAVGPAAVCAEARGRLVSEAIDQVAASDHVDHLAAP